MVLEPLGSGCGDGPGAEGLNEVDVGNTRQERIRGPREECVWDTDRTVGDR